MGNKYSGLTQYLLDQHAAGNDRLTLSFSEIERIIVQPLSAYCRKYFWGNDRTQPFARSWLAADFVVAKGGCRLQEEMITFEYDPNKVAALYRGDYRTPENTAPRTAQSHRRQKRDDIPDPSALEVNKYLLLWDDMEKYRLQESALNRLFFELCPANTQIEDVLLKASTLNDFYGTNIYSIFPVASHIQSLNIDERLQRGDLTLVDDIANDGTGFYHYSFASKYCSHHKPAIYPIYDSYIEAILCYFRDVDSFAVFQGNDLKVYKQFWSILTQFCKHYNLQQYTLKQIDQYLWQLGKSKFPKKFK